MPCTPGVACTESRRHESWPCALWNFQVTDIAIHDFDVEVAKGRTQLASLALLRVKFDHDDSELSVMLVREIPQLLDAWRRRPIPRQPLRLQYMWPMQVVSASAEQRYFAVSNCAGEAVGVGPHFADRAAAPA